MAIFYANPRLDYLFGFLGGEPVPTKKDSFKPIKDAVISSENGEEILKDIYQKNPSNRRVKEFQLEISDLAKSVIKENTIKRPFVVEVILSFSITQSRCKEVDIDNLAKSVLDGLTGVAYEDDSQVSCLICNKYVHENNLNSLLIGITKLTKTRKGFGTEIKLISDSIWQV